MCIRDRYDSPTQSSGQQRRYEEIKKFSDKVTSVICQDRVNNCKNFQSDVAAEACVHDQHENCRESVRSDLGCALKCNDECHKMTKYTSWSSCLSKCSDECIPEKANATPHLFKGEP
eukprot:TRINITY_DN2986_c0_g3_i2.p1 TRINITY_DN2986_c0_g3~~TRINITY_DN2986_c0_g3_i2.p1  ORF type:complete len:133 (-),score=31.54 TRINITY_DN2986_c0_g3_i2:120-470(-)